MNNTATNTATCPTVRKPVSYTHLDVYKRQALLRRLRRQDVCPPHQQRQAYFSIYPVSYTHLTVHIDFEVSHQPGKIRVYRQFTQEGIIHPPTFQ